MITSSLQNFSGGAMHIGPASYQQRPPPLIYAPLTQPPPPPPVTTPNRNSTARPSSQQPTGRYTRVQQPGGENSLQAGIDYDQNEDDLDNRNGAAPIRGPIYSKNGSAPVVPLYGYQKVDNGSLLQIPIFWTALSFALGHDIGGGLIPETPCVERNHQLFCPTAGKNYPVDRIDRFIHENKGLMKRMYGEFEMMEDGPIPKAKRSTARKRRQNTSFSDNQSEPNKLLTEEQSPADSGRTDVCESKMELINPYWATNIEGKTRAIVNTEHFEQAIYQEVCTKPLTSRCSKDCGCEQKYKWHRLLAYDPDTECKGIFMDWFLFPSCCVCRCDSITPSSV